MYKIGDRIVYPMHGAGTIEAIEEKEILGSKQNYYIMRIPLGDMKVMIPMANCDEIGIRDVISSTEADKVLAAFEKYDTDCNLTWNKRYRENMIKIKSGNIYEVAEVVKALMCRDKEKGLSTGERKLLSNSKQILISELVLAKGVSRDSIEEIINDIVNK